MMNKRSEDLGYQNGYQNPHFHRDLFSHIIKTGMIDSRTKYGVVDWFAGCQIFGQLQAKSPKVRQHSNDPGHKIIIDFPESLPNTDVHEL